MKILIVLTIVCSLRNELINGKNIKSAASPHEFKSIVDLRRGSSSLHYHLCSGVIINPNWVLTISTCTARLFKIVAGDQNADLVEGTEQTVSSVMSYKHPNSTISLIKVSPAFTFNSYVQPAVLPPSDLIGEGQTGVTAGWNPTTNGGYFQPILQKNPTLVTFSSSNCNYGSVGPQTVCASSEGESRCSGENGSPFICESNNYLCGIIGSRGDCSRDSPNSLPPPNQIQQSIILTAPFKNWIQETIATKS